jgi:hypothetical protein
MIDAERGAMGELEEARLDASVRAAREPPGPPGEPLPVRREPAAPPLVSAEAPQVIREVLFNGTVVTTNITPQPPAPNGESRKFGPRVKRANPADFHGIGRKLI